MVRDLRGYICSDCAKTVCRNAINPGQGSPMRGDTIHQGTCGWCGRDKPITHVRNYGGVKEDDNA